VSTKTGADRQRRYRERMRNLGMTQVTVTIPEEFKDEFQRLVVEAQQKHFNRHLRRVVDDRGDAAQ
jgi:hypothetical protein